MSFIYHTFFFDPLYNALIALFNLIPWADAGIIVILLTILVRLALFPFSKKAVLTQVRMNEIAPQVEQIKLKYKDKPEAQARETLALYREKKINPFAGILVIIIQLPLIFALYQIFLHFSEVRTDLLYSFVSVPDVINSLFLGIVDISGKSIILALLAAISTFLQLYFSPTNLKTTESKNPSMADTLSRNMQKQMKYVFPVIVFFISYQVPAVISLYWVTTNIFSIAQELTIKKQQLLQA